jgi:hypothetical protein
MGLVTRACYGGAMGSTQMQPDGRTVLRPGVPFNGVKVFSATMFADREQLGEKVTAWIASRSDCTITEIVVTQSSDAAFHCIALTVFYRSPAH